MIFFRNIVGYSRRRKRTGLSDATLSDATLDVEYDSNSIEI